MTTVAHGQEHAQFRRSSDSDRLKEIEHKMTKLDHAIFGLHEADVDTGLLNRMGHIDKRLGKIYFALLAAIISFTTMSITIIVTILSLEGKV